MVPTPTQFLDVPGGRLAYDDTGGSAPLVVAVPGMGDLRGEYRHLVPYLTAAGYRVVTMDVRGHGESSTGWDDYSARAVGQDVLALIEHLGADHAAVMGTSFAAGSVAWAAHDAPEKVSALVFLGPVVRDLPIPWFKQAAVKAGFAGPWRVGFWMTFWGSLFPTATPADHAEYRRTLRANLSEPGRMDALRAMVALSKRDTEAMLGSVRKPALIIMGTKDPDFPDPAQEASRVAARTQGETVLIEGAGHYPHAEMPQVVGPRLVAFLKGVR
ncbi:MAG: alpha/beta hydrolase [Isosphaeraceae bacterium]|nr:alpha/beta hydrolase [Isosphaeraceae bacterium]